MVKRSDHAEDLSPTDPKENRIGRREREPDELRGDDRKPTRGKYEPSEERTQRAEESPSGPEEGETSPTDEQRYGEHGERRAGGRAEHSPGKDDRPPRSTAGGATAEEAPRGDARECRREDVNDQCTARRGAAGRQNGERARRRRETKRTVERRDARKQTMN